MMEIPSDINTWDYATILEIVTSHDFERDNFDFKEVLNARGSNENPGTHRMNISQTVCSMANSDGGYIIFGVKDPKKHPNLSPEQRIVGIPKSGENLKEFGNKISNIHPSVYCIPRQTYIDIPNDSTKGIFVVYVPLSPRRPHMVDGEGRFLIRGPGGSADTMPYYQVRDQMLYTEGRLQKVRLLRLIIKQYLEQRQMLINQEDNMDMSLLRFDTGAFNSILADVCELIPFSSRNLVEELLKIPFTANLINESLSRGSYPGLRLHVPDTPDPRVQSRATIKQNLDVLEQICTMCEQEFADKFGSLYQV